MCPIYEYQCDGCKKVFEIIQSVDRKPTAKCIDCNSKKVSNVIGTPHFKLKGEGFYKSNDSLQ